MRALNGELEQWLRDALRYFDARAEGGDPEPSGVMRAADLHAQGRVHLERVKRDIAKVERVRGKETVQ